MQRRPKISVARLHERWRESPWRGGVSGILSVTLATLVVALACAVIALITTVIF